jgi:hypothetical protein
MTATNARRVSPYFSFGCRARLLRSETQVIRSGADLSFAARANDVAGAVLIGTEERSTSLNLFVLGWLVGVKGNFGSVRIAGNSAG